MGVLGGLPHTPHKASLWMNVGWVAPTQAFDPAIVKSLVLQNVQIIRESKTQANCVNHSLRWEFLVALTDTTEMIMNGCWMGGTNPSNRSCDCKIDGSAKWAHNRKQEANYLKHSLRWELLVAPTDATVSIINWWMLDGWHQSKLSILGFQNSWFCEMCT